MGKSLAMTTGGLDFDSFMRKLINAETEEKPERKRATGSKRKRKRKRDKSRG